VGNRFAKNLKELRIAKSYTQYELAKKLKITQRKISYLENDKVEPDLCTLISIAKFFAITLDELVLE
jgi:transcriptional regulator with XRE-family HTH domain